MSAVLSATAEGLAPPDADDRTGDLLSAARAVAAVAGRHAEDVDKHRRFPFEAVAALRHHRLMSVAVPASRGGRGTSLRTLASMTRLLGEACASTAMIYAMHQSQIACLIDHGPADAWHDRLFRTLVAQQLLIASATSEETIGGDLRASACAVVPSAPGRFTLAKRTPTISYGAHADVILVTARRNSTASSNDQVLLTQLSKDYLLSKTHHWDTLGMCGTCSDGFFLQGRGRTEQILPTPFGEIAEHSMLPVSHILWSAAWLGIATDAVRRGQRYLRQQARQRAGTIAPGSGRLADALGLLRTMEAVLDAALDRTDRSNYSTTIALNDLKIRMSTTAIEIVDQIMQFCGMAAYRNDSPFSLGRHLRDLRAAPLMINNDRLSATSSVLMLGERIR